MENKQIFMILLAVVAMIAFLIVKIIPFFARLLSSETCRKAKRRDGFFSMAVPSVIGVCLCAVCLCGTSWAWFTASQTSSVSDIQAATYSVEVTAAIDEIPVEVPETVGRHQIALESGKLYTLFIIANGTASHGYCTVTLGEQVYHTPQIGKNETFLFEIHAYQSGNLTITSQWGTCAISENVIDPVVPLIFGTAPSGSEPGGMVFAASPFDAPEFTTDAPAAGPTAGAGEPESTGTETSATPGATSPFDAPEFTTDAPATGSTAGAGEPESTGTEPSATPGATSPFDAPEFTTDEPTVEPTVGADSMESVEVNTIME